MVRLKRDLLDVPPPLHDLYVVNKDFNSHRKSDVTLKVLTDTTSQAQVHSNREPRLLSVSSKKSTHCEAKSVGSALRMAGN